MSKIGLLLAIISSLTTTVNALPTSHNLEHIKRDFSFSNISNTLVVVVVVLLGFLGLAFPLVMWWWIKRPSEKMLHECWQEYGSRLPGRYEQMNGRGPTKQELWDCWGEYKKDYRRVHAFSDSSN